MGLFDFIGDLFGGGDETVVQTTTETKTEQAITVGVEPHITSNVDIQFEFEEVARALESAGVMVSESVQKSIAGTAAIEALKMQGQTALESKKFMATEQALEEGLAALKKWLTPILLLFAFVWITKR